MSHLMFLQLNVGTGKIFHFFVHIPLELQLQFS